MKTLTSFIVCLCLLSPATIGPVFADAAPTTPGAAPAVTPPVPVLLANALGPVKKLAALFAPAWSLTYTDTLTFKQYGGTLAPVTKTLTISAELTKTNKYKLDMGPGGVLTSDGTSNLAVNASKTHYAKYAAPGDFTVGRDWAFVSSKVLDGASSVLNYSLGAYLFAHIADADFTDPQSMTVASWSTKLDGKPVIDTEYKSAFTDVHLYIDSATSLLTEAHSLNTDQYGRVTDVTDLFTNLTVVPKQLAATEFATTPPPGATAIALPVPPVVKPPKRPSTRPKSTKPNRGSSNTVVL